MEPTAACLLSAALLATQLPRTPGFSDLVRVAGLVRVVAPQKPPDDPRWAAEAALKELDPRLALPAVLTELERLSPFKDDASNPFAPPVAEDDRPDVERAERSLRRIWRHYVIAGRSDYPEPIRRRSGTLVPPPGEKRTFTAAEMSAIGKTLASLLKGSRTDRGRSLVLGGLAYNYSAEAEVSLAAMLRDDRRPGHGIAIQILLEHHSATYAPAVIGWVADPKRPLGQRKFYFEIFDGLPYHYLAPAGRCRLIRAGFAILAEDRDYFTARSC